MIEIGILKIEDDVVQINDAILRLGKRASPIFNRVAEAEGAFVPKSAFIAEGLTPNKNALKVHMTYLRRKFKRVGVEDIFLSTPPNQGYTKGKRQDGYALNLEAFKR